MVLVANNKIYHDKNEGKLLAISIAMQMRQNNAGCTVQ
jgi:hypothetical protein